MFKRFSVLILVLIAAIVVQGCASGGGPFSSLHYGGEGMLTGAAVGGITSAAITKGNPLFTAVGAIGGAIVGGLVGGQISKGSGIAERDMGLQAKQFALLQECRRDEWNRVEQSVRYSQAYGGKPADYYKPDYSRCDRQFMPVAPSIQPPRNIGQPYNGQPNYGANQQPTYTPQFNFRQY